MESQGDAVTITQKIGIIIYGIVCLLLTIGLFSWSEKRTRERLEIERQEMDRMLNELQAVKDENAAMREIMAKANVAVERAAVAVQDAKDKADEREQILVTDTPTDWLMCDLPDSVQDMFADYCHED